MRTVPVLVLLSLVACGPMDDSPPGPEQVEISVADDASALTAQASDVLFALTLTRATRAYVLNDISVDVGLPGQTASAVNFVHEDGNGNGKLDQGEKLTCKEPPVNLFDTTTVGKAVNVNIAEMVSGTFFRIGSATWSPAN